MTSLFQDLRHAARSLSKRPGFTAAAVITLALGIGANTVMFSALHRLILKPLPFEGGDRMVRIMMEEASGMSMSGAAAPLFPLFKQESHSLEDVESWLRGQRVIRDEGSATLVSVRQISPGFLSFLGLRPERGRMFTRDEAQAMEPVALIGYGIWQRRYGGARDIIGRTVTLDQTAYTVIGIMPERLRYLPRGEADLWLPLQPALGDGTLVVLFGRLRSGVSMEAAENELDRIAAELPNSGMGGSGDWSVGIRSLGGSIASGDLKTAILALFGAVTFVLLIACANVAHLTLARATARGRELAVRRALGAGRVRLVRQLLSESVLLSLLGGAAGLLFAWWGVDALAALRPSGLAELDRVAVDGRVLLFTLSVAAIATGLFGLFPALRATRTDPARRLAGESTGTASGGARGHFRGALIAGQVALSLVLLVGTGLLVTTLFQLGKADTGFRPEGLFMMRVTMPEEHFPDEASRQAFLVTLLERSRTLPDIRSTAVASDLPLGYAVTFGRRLYARPNDGSTIEGPGRWAVNPVGAGYLRTAGIPILEGRARARGTALRCRAGRPSRHHDRHRRIGQRRIVGELAARTARGQDRSRAGAARGVAGACPCPPRSRTWPNRVRVVRVMSGGPYLGP